MAGVEGGSGRIEPAWRERAVSRSLDAARSRAEQRTQRFLDAAFELIDEKGTTEFTIQEVVERSKQSLRGFYEYFDGKDELVLALFEETHPRSRRRHPRRRRWRDRSTRPAARLRDPPPRVVRPGRLAPQAGNAQPAADIRVLDAAGGQPRGPGPGRARRRVSHLLRELIDAAADGGRDPGRRRPARRGMVQQTVMYSWFGNRLVENPKLRLTAEETWEFCLHGLGANETRA